MEELLEFQKKIKTLSLENLLDALVDNSPSPGMNLEAKEKCKYKIFVLKLEILSRFNESILE